jgi:DNA-binding CsgD family transcriptional regulator/tetratricopeptide (TPR) repeat protein
LTGKQTTTGRPRTAAVTGLLERTSHLEGLAALYDAVARTSEGVLILLGGEAGVGKTKLLQWFCDGLGGSGRVLWGACDPLFTPRALGPILDVAAAAGGDLELQIKGSAAPHEVVTALVRELRTTRPRVVVLEDLHWADEATLDVLRLVARRVHTVPALFIASYRDDELDRVHPLRVAIGELVTAKGVERLKVEPLSEKAVATLAASHVVNASELYERTLGNPFFVTEVLAAGEGVVPETVRDAVLARAARLSPKSRELVDAVAITPPHAELWVLEKLAPDSLDRLDECLASGMLTAVPGGVAFRHELARCAIEETLAPHRAISLHRVALAALANAPDGTGDLARLAHHAEAAGDSAAVLRFAPQAAERAAALGAHREAAAQYERALRFADALPLDARARLLVGRAHECYVADRYGEAVDAIHRALELHRALGDRRSESDGLRSLAQMLWSSGRPAEAERAGREAIAVLDGLPPGRELAMAQAVLASRCMNAESFGEAAAWGTEALELSERLGAIEIFVHALNTLGTIDLLAGATGGERLEESRRLAEREGMHEQVARAFANAAWAAVRTRSYARFSAGVDSWLEYCTEHGLELWRLYLLGYRARSELDQGRWDEAADTAALVLRVPRGSPLPRIVALVVLALVRLRRGDPGVAEALDEAAEYAESSGELQRLEPVAAARAEAAWLKGDMDAALSATESALGLARKVRSPWVVGELACWRRRAGEDESPLGAAEPYALELAGDWTGAALRWTERGCPYEAALAVAGADEEVALRRSLDVLQQLCAKPAANAVARRLRSLGARGVRRGPRAATRRNPANLTGREVEVLELLAQGRTNSQIADALWLSESTVRKHVEHVYGKLGVRTRAQASAEAARLGLAAKDQ